MAWYTEKSGKRRRPETFSEEEDRKTVRGTVFPTSAIQTCLTFKVLFGLPLRQAVGLVGSLIRMVGLDWPVPDFSTLCRRQARIAVQIPYRASGQPLNLQMDSSGIKFRGDGQRSISLWMRAPAMSARSSSSQVAKATVPCYRSDWTKSGRTVRSRPSRRTALMIRGDAMAQSSSAMPMRSSLYAAMGAPGKKTAPPRSRETRSCTPPGIWAGDSGKDGPGITFEVGSRPA